jgi:hypothetical protein
MQKNWNSSSSSCAKGDGLDKPLVSPHVDAAAVALEASGPQLGLAKEQLGIPHDVADELHLDDFLFVFPTHQPLTFSTHERGLIPQIYGVVVNKVFARERARVLHEH